MKKDGEMFAIVKTAHRSKYDELQRSSFQMNNTLLATDRSVLGEIAAPSIEYCNKLKTDDEAFLDKDKKAFLNCFKKTEKSSQKGAESIDFTGVFMIDYEEGREKNVS